MKVKLVKYETTKTSNGSMSTLYMYPEGQTRVLTQRFYNNKMEQSLRSKAIWINAIERQQNVPQEERTAPAAQLTNYYTLIEGMTPKKAEEKVAKHYEGKLLSFVGKSIEVYRTENIVGTTTYVNYQPYEPVQPDAAEVEDFE